MKRFLILLCGVFAAVSVFGQPSVRIAQGPWLQQVTTDGFTVVWTTTMDAAVWVEVAPDDGTHFYATARPRYYDSHLGKRRTGHLHKVRIEGLEPGKTYRYRVVQQGVVVDEGNKRVILGEGYGPESTHNATTLDPTKKAVEFWVVNDIHGRDSIFRLLIQDAPKTCPDFVCLNGDMLSAWESEAEIFKGFLSTAAKTLTPAGIPIFAVRGNHENRGSFSQTYLDYFPTPTGESYYGFRQGPVYFLVLDGGEDKPDSDIRYYGLATSDAYREQEAAWLQKTVQSEEFRSAPYRIVLIHMLPGGKDSWRGEQEIRRLFAPTLTGANIDLMLCGHYHRYAFIDDDSRGTDFPIVVNSNNDKLVVRADDREIGVKVVDTAGKTIKEHHFSK